MLLKLTIKANDKWERSTEHHVQREIDNQTLEQMDWDSLPTDEMLHIPYKPSVDGIFK